MNLIVKKQRVKWDNAYTQVVHQEPFTRFTFVIKAKIRLNTIYCFNGVMMKNCQWFLLGSNKQILLCPFSYGYHLSLCEHKPAQVF